MGPLFALIAAVPIFISGFIFYAHQRTYGTLLDITTSSVAYDRTTYHDRIDWDKYSITIAGERTMIFAGEFHYWRVPDRERWPDILKQYRGMGMNAIRIYFHWGYHSPDEGVYLFDGNRDVDYLLDLCEDMGLFVLAAPGPYICAETSAGGYPPWLIAKRELRIRHNKIMLWREYDPDFAEYEKEWLHHVLPIIAKHQITDKKNGCVIGLQLDNELFETMAIILPIGLRDQMRVLAKAARDEGIHVPLLSNDGFEESSWVPRPELDARPAVGVWSNKPFGLDWYGFDKYVVLAPTSNPTSWFFDTGNSTLGWKPWSAKQLENSMDRLEHTVRAFGSGARDSPMFIPELQGGWFNHYQLQHTYDTIYDYYGPYYTKILYESSLAQGVTMVNLYMGYGGTNWGALGDPDVYTSYDYSACIREYGYLSERGRNLRETNIFARSFDPYFAKTEQILKRKNYSVKSSVRHTINNQRVAVESDQPVTFTFFRNFARNKEDLFDVTVDHDGGNFTMGCYMPYKTSFIGLGNYKTVNDIQLIQSTLPIHARMVNTETREEVWLVEPNPIGGIAFEHRTMEVSGNMQDDVLRREGTADMLKFDKHTGWIKLSTNTGDLYIVGIRREDANTLYGHFEDAFWNEGQKRYPAFFAWGADTFYYDNHKNLLVINFRRSDSHATLLSFKKPTDTRFAPATTGPYAGLPFLYVMESTHAHQRFPLPVDISLDKWQERTVQFDTLPWHPIQKRGDTPVFENLDYLYVHGHVLYRTEFANPNRSVSLSLNARNRATVILNGVVIGGHTTYSRQLFSPGAKIGPDPPFLGTHTYPLTDLQDHNTLVILVDSFGLSRQAFIMNDVRNPRGILKAKLNGVGDVAWQITGTDVRQLPQPFNTIGFPDEQEVSTGWQAMQTEHDDRIYRIPVSKAQGAQWVRFQFDDLRKVASASMTVPLRLHLNGPFTAFVFLNDVQIADYYGNGDGPQHDFYLPGGLVKKHNVVRMLVYTWQDTTAEIMVAGWPVRLDSGNVDETQPEYMVWKEEAKFSI